MIDTGADWHTHSTTSDGMDSLEAMALAGAAAGLHTVGLSDHVRSTTTWLPEYVTAVRALRIGGLRVGCGVEVKMLDTRGTLDLPARLPTLDYLLIADHQFPGADGPASPRAVRGLVDSGRLSRSDAVEQIVRATCSALRRSPVPAIVAHLFSLLPKCGLGEEDVGQDLIDELAAAAVATGSAVEVNEKWRCPSARVVAVLAAGGVRITAGSDAHKLADVGRWTYVHDVARA